MHRNAKITTAAILGALIAGGASGCGPSADLILWTGFGAAYTQMLNSTLVEPYVAQSGVTIENQSQGSYDKLQSNLNNSISTSSYPNFANGYPDHFAGYIKSNIQVPLDDYIDAYNKKNNVDLIADYYPEYMTENTTLKYKEDGTGYIMGLPFNKSTEVMGYNGVFMEYAQSLDNTIKVPETWDEWKVQGPKMLKVMDNLYGKHLYGIEDANDPDKHSAFEPVSPDAAPPSGKTLLLDCSTVTKERFRLLSWDSSDNMFITIIRQWGAEYTSYTSDDAKKYQHGWAEFASGENRAKTLEAMQFFLDLYNDGIFGLPGNISDSSYSSTAFKANQCMFTICSSGGLSYNIGTFRFKVAPIPYKDADKKYVISQGTSLGLFDQGTEEQKQKAFDAIVAFTTGDLQGAWAAETGYYPASKSATNSQVYQDLINGTAAADNDSKKAYMESAQLNEKYYMNSESGWIKFVDPGFVGSSVIRTEVGTIMGIVLAKESTLEDILDESMKTLSTYDPANKK